MKQYDKLIRDKIPEIIEKSGRSCKTEALSDEERGRFIRKWYHEETVDDLRLEIDELSSRLGVYEWVLRKYHLIEIADAEYEEARQRRISFELSIDSDKEVPF